MGKMSKPRILLIVGGGVLASFAALVLLGLLLGALGVSTAPTTPATVPVTTSPVRDPEPAPPTTVKQATQEQSTSGYNDDATGAAKFNGVDRSNYEDANTVCRVSSVEKVANSVGLSANADVTDIAQAYSEKYRGAFRQAVFEGCLHALLLK